MSVQCRKAYVSVNLDVDQEGVFHPRFIRWENGLIFQIDQILYKCRASSKKVGGGGIRYTVLIRGRNPISFRREASGSLKRKGPDDDFISEENRRNCSSRDQGLQ